MQIHKGHTSIKTHNFDNKTIATAERHRESGPRRISGLIPGFLNTQVIKVRRITRKEKRVDPLNMLKHLISLLRVCEGQVFLARNKLGFSATPSRGSYEGCHGTALLPARQ